LKILFITARFPFPPLTGDKSIPYQRLKHLSRKHDITLLSFSDDLRDSEYSEEIRKYCTDIHVVSLRRAQAYGNLMSGMFGHTPFQVLYYRSNRFKTALNELLRENRYDLIHAFMLRIAPYTSEYRQCPKIIELIDSMALNMRRRASLENGIRKLIFTEEARRVSRYEAEVAERFDRAVVVSDIDAKAIGADNIVVAPLGVDLQHFFPGSLNARDGNLIIFTGNMRYFPNEMALLYFTRDIFPLIQKRRPGAKFWVIGAAPSRAIRQLERANRAIRVLGFVDSMCAHISLASVSVCPMLAGSGMQFKILEALACGVPVVATSVAKGDIKLGEGDGLFVADQPAVFADKVIRTMIDTKLRENIASRAPEAVQEKYSWRRSNLAIDRIYSELLHQPYPGTGKGSCASASVRMAPVSV